MKIRATLVAASLCLAALSSVNAQDLTITNVRIVGPDAKVIERGSIVVRGGKIVSVAAGNPASTAGRTIDAKGMSAMPGFIDGHRHINTGPNEKAQMQALLEAGYTTVLSGGGPAEGNITLRDHIEQRHDQRSAHYPLGVYPAEQQHARHGARRGAEDGRHGH